MCDWVCYCLVSLEKNNTYIGATNNIEKRLNNHNSKSPSRTGAKYTRGQTWIVAVLVTGFATKNSCLSFESGWKRLSKRRNKKRLTNLNFLSQIKLKYTRDTLNNRIIDLLYFVNYATSDGKKYIMSNKKLYTISNNLVIYSINNVDMLKWPPYVKTKLF